MEPHWGYVMAGTPAGIDPFIQPSVRLSTGPPTNVPCARFLDICWEGNCGYDTFSVLKEPRVNGADITESTAALSVTWADDWTHSRRASASQLSHCFWAQKPVSRQMGSTEKSARMGE